MGRFKRFKPTKCFDQYEKILKPGYFVGPRAKLDKLIPGELPSFAHSTLSNTDVYISPVRHVKIELNKAGPFSAGARDFVQNRLPALAQANPTIAFSVLYNDEIKSKTYPRITGEYTTGLIRRVIVRNLDESTVAEKLKQHVLETNGVQLNQWPKRWNSTLPSIQGVWNPFMFQKKHQDA